MRKLSQINELFSASMKRNIEGTKRKEDKRHLDPVWYRNIVLPDIQKYDKKLLTIWNFGYDYIIFPIKRITKTEPEIINVEFDDENWSFVLEHNTAYGSNTYSAYCKGGHAPYEIKFSELGINEKRSIYHRIISRKFYLYTESRDGVYTLREDEVYNNVKGKLLKK